VSAAISVIQSKCFWKRHNTAWPCRVEPSSDHAVPTAAMYSVRELREQSIWSLLYYFLLNTVPWKRGELEVRLHSFLISTLDAGDWSASRSRHQGKSVGYTFHKRFTQ